MTSWYILIYGALLSTIFTVVTPPSRNNKRPERLHDIYEITQQLFPLVPAHLNGTKTSITFHSWLAFETQF
jgi:hypothetical protein